MTGYSQSVELPPVVVSKLRAICRRIRLTRTVEGVLTTATALLVAMMAAMLVDAVVVLFEPFWRCVLTLVSLGLAGVVLGVTVVRPLFAPRRYSAVARELERAVPGLEERWLTLTELAESRDPPAIRGADALIEAVATEAVAADWRIDARRIASFGRARMRTAALAVALAVLVVALLVKPDRTRLLLRRFWSPRTPITQTQIISLTGSLVVPIGEPLILEAVMSGRPQPSAQLLVRGNGRSEHAVTVTTSDELPGRFTYSLRPVRDSFDYRWQCGDGRTPRCSITAEDRPFLKQARLRITPPAYSKLPGEEHTALPRIVRALRGSRLEVELLPTRPLAQMELLLGSETKEVISPGEGPWYRYATTLGESMMFSPRLIDQHGLTSTPLPFCRVIVYADQPPSVRITAPDTDLVVKPGDAIEIEFEAMDDLGIASAELVVTKEDGKEATTEVVPIPLGKDAGARFVRRTTRLDLAALQLEPGSKAGYAVRVRDTRAAATTATMPAPGTATQPAPGREAADATATAQSPTTGPATQPAGKPTAEQIVSVHPSARTEKTCCPPGSRCAKCAPGAAGPNRPSDKMTRRPLDAGESTARSNTQRIEVQDGSRALTGDASRKRQESQHADRADHQPNKAETAEAGPGNGKRRTASAPSATRPGGDANAAAAPQGPDVAKERDWNVLATKLRDELRQGRDTVPPEEYRQAIDDYFRGISDALSQPAPQWK